MDETSTLVDWLEGDGDLDLEAWRHRLIVGRNVSVPFGRRPSLADQLEMLADGFAGECALLWLHAALNVALRRGIQPERNGRRFLDLWQRHADLLLELLDSRWLISACDSFADLHPDPAQAALAASAAFLVNTVKLYETERRARSGTDPFPAGVPFTEIFDGLTTFLPDRGDMVANLVSRFDASSARAVRAPAAPSVVAAILRELVSRLLSHDSVFQRARPLARFPWPVGLTPLPPPVPPAPRAGAAGHAPPGAGSAAPGWLLLNDGSRLAGGFHIGRLASAQALREGLARRGLVARGWVNDAAALPALLAPDAGAIRLLVLDASGLRADGERARGLLAACREARRAGLATAVIQAGPGWSEWQPFDRAFVTDPELLAGVPGGVPAAVAEDPALVLFAALIAEPAADPPHHPLAVVDSPDPGLAATLQRFARAAAAPMLTMTSPALERLRAQALQQGNGVPGSWPRLMRAPRVAEADHWLADRSAALILALCAGRSVSVPPGATAAALGVLRRFGLQEVALLPPDWREREPDEQVEMVRQQASGWDADLTARVAAERSRACGRVAAMFDSLAGLASAPGGPF